MTSEENFTILLQELADLLRVPQLLPDEDGVVLLEIDSMPFYLQYAAGRESVVFTCELAILPVSTPAGVYRQLLAAQLFDQGTGGGKFAIEEETNTVVFSFERALDGVPFSLFEEILQNFLRVCDYWHKKLVSSDTRTDSSDGAPKRTGALRV